MTGVLKTIARSGWFNWGITGIIIGAAVVVGIETYPGMVERHGGTLHFLNGLVLWIFVAEVVIKMGAEGSRPWRYFNDPWNVFDFAIVAACFLPFNAQYVTVLRLVRLLRVLKLVRALPRLQILVSALLKSLPSIGYVSVLLGLLFYLYGVAAVFLFSANDPVHFGNLQIALLSLFRVVTLEDWTDIMYIQMQGCANYGYEGIESLCTASQAQPLLGAMFFVSFVLLGTMIVLNLFIGIIMAGMDEARSEQEAEGRESEPTPPSGLEGELCDLGDELVRLHTRILEIQARVAAEEVVRIPDLPDPARAAARRGGGTPRPGV